MMRCENKVAQTYYPALDPFPRTIELPCGSTSIHGGTLVCEDCQSKHYAGWPDRCPHGVPVQPWDGYCPACEFGE